MSSYGIDSLFPDLETRGARATDPDTSHEASAGAQRRRGHRLVLQLLADHGPLSDFDLAQLSGFKQTSIGKRRGELRDLGLVERHDRNAVSDTGAPCIRWRLTNQ